MTSTPSLIADLHEMLADKFVDPWTHARLSAAADRLAAFQAAADTILTLADETDRTPDWVAALDGLRELVTGT